MKVIVFFIETFPNSQNKMIKTPVVCVYSTDVNILRNVQTHGNDLRCMQRAKQTTV